MILGVHYSLKHMSRRCSELITSILITNIIIVITTATFQCFSNY